MAGIQSIDEQLAEATRRRENALDLLVRSLIEVDTCTARIDVLLDRRARGEASIDQTDQMT